MGKLQVKQGLRHVNKSCPISRFLQNHSSKFSSNSYLAVPAYDSSSGLAHWHVSGLGREEDHLAKKNTGIRLWHLEDNQVLSTKHYSENYTLKSMSKRKKVRTRSCNFKHSWVLKVWSKTI